MAFLPFAHPVKRETPIIRRDVSDRSRRRWADRPARWDFNGRPSLPCDTRRRAPPGRSACSGRGRFLDPGGGVRVLSANAHQGSSTTYGFRIYVRVLFGRRPRPPARPTMPPVAAPATSAHGRLPPASPRRRPVPGREWPVKAQSGKQAGKAAADHAADAEAPVAGAGRPHGRRRIFR